MSEEDLRKYEFRRVLEEIEKYSGRGTELISLYIPPGKQIYDVVAYLREEYSTSSNIKSKGTRKNVMSAIESIMSRLKYFKKPPENGLVFFVGEVAKRGDQTEMVAHVMEPPEPVKSFVYRCDSRFYTEPLEDMFGHKDVYGLITIDRSEATIGLLRGTSIEIVANIQSLVPSKHHQGGQSSRRFERLIELAAHEFFKKVGDKASEIFLPENVKGIFIGGPGATKEYFASKDYLHHELMKRIIDLYDTGYTDEYGIRELVEKVSQTIEDLEIAREKKLVQRFMKEVKKVDGGLAVYGEKAVKKALEMGAVDVLLISDGLRKVRYTMKCETCGAEKIVESKTPPEIVCDKCGVPMKVAAEEDMLRHYYELAKSMSTDVEMISTESEEGQLLLKAFGGIVGILRYKI